MSWASAPLSSPSLQSSADGRHPITPTLKPDGWLMQRVSLCFFFYSFFFFFKGSMKEMDHMWKNWYTLTAFFFYNNLLLFPAFFIYSLFWKLPLCIFFICFDINSIVLTSKLINFFNQILITLKNLKKRKLVNFDEKKFDEN